jgi:PAS domain S-box-containing protein
MKNEFKNKKLSVSLSDEMELAGIQAFPFSSEYKDLYAQLFKSIKLPLLIVDPATCRILDANYSAVALFDYPDEILRQFTLYKFFTDADVRLAFNNPDDKSCSTSILHLKYPIGDLKYFNSISGYVNLKHKKVCYVFLEEKAGDGQENVNPAGSDEAVIITDASGSILRINEVFSSILGYDSDELTGKSIIKTFPELNLHPGSNPSAVPVIYKTYRKNRAPVFIELRSSAIMNRDNSINGLVFRGKEVTPAKFIQNEILWLAGLLEESGETNLLPEQDNFRISNNRMVTNTKTKCIRDENILSNANDANNTKIIGLCHEFRTQMNIVLGFSEILGRELSNNEQNEMVSLIADSGLKIMTIFNLAIEMMMPEKLEEIV